VPAATAHSHLDCRSNRFFFLCSTKHMRFARDWDAKDSGAGYATRFRVRRDRVTKFQAQTVGDSSHQELWVLAEALTAFNGNFVGEIEVIAEFRK
jgi:hypothetical protein